MNPIDNFVGILREIKDEQNNDAPVFGNRIYAVTRPEDASGWPCLIYQLNSGLSVSGFRGSYNSITVQIDIYARGFEDIYRFHEMVVCCLYDSDLLADNIEEPFLLHDPDIAKGIYRLTFSVMLSP